MKNNKKKRKGFITIRLEILETDFNRERFCEWSQEGEVHRENNHPAVLYTDCRFWYLRGEEIHSEFDDITGDD